MGYLRQICSFHFFFVKKLKNPTLSNFWGNLGADLLERSKSFMLWNIQAEFQEGEGRTCYILPLPGAPGCGCIFSASLNSSSFLSFPKATFSPETNRRPCSWCMDACQNDIAQCNQHMTLVVLYLSAGSTWAVCENIWTREKQKNWGGFYLRKEMEEDH